MQSSPAIEALADVVEAGGLLDPRSSGVVLVSGGADSACAAAALSTLCGPASVAAIHLNYGLRPDSDRDERAARALCAKLRIDLHVERPSLPAGNVQARAREARYEAAERLRARLDGDWIATGHTRTDVAETVIYRLAASPGTRPLLGLAPRNGWVVRPLHAISRAETRAVAEEADLPFVDDPTNSSPRFARNRIRGEVLPVLAEIGTEAERNIAATHAELHEEAELLAIVVDEALDRAGASAGGRISAAELSAMHPALRRLALRELAGRAAGAPVPLSRARAARIAQLAARPEGGEVELGGGVSAICEGGAVHFSAPEAAAAEPPAPVRMTIPGSARFGDWDVVAEVVRGPISPAGPTSRRSTRRRSVRRSRSGAGGPATGSGRSASAGPRACRTSSPIMACLVRSALTCPWSPSAAGSSGSPAWRSPTSSGFSPPPARSRSCARTGSGHSPALPPRQPRSNFLYPVPVGPPPGGSGREAEHFPGVNCRVAPPNDGIGEVLIDRERLHARVAELGAQIDADYAGRDLVLVGVLKGALIFMSDLMRALSVPCEIDLMAVSSYGSSTASSGVVRILKDLDTPISGRDVLIVEDIIDSGLTLQYLMRNLRARDPGSLEVCALLTKPERRRVDLPIRYVGFEIEDRFAIGYGLDHQQRYRNLDYVAALAD